MSLGSLRCTDDDVSGASYESTVRTKESQRPLAEDFTGSNIVECWYCFHSLTRNLLHRSAPGTPAKSNCQMMLSHRASSIAGVISKERVAICILRVLHRIIQGVVSTHFLGNEFNYIPGTWKHQCSLSGPGQTFISFNSHKKCLCKCPSDLTMTAA